MGKSTSTIVRPCAGGILMHPTEGIALVHSYDQEEQLVITFPKGKIEKGEDPRGTVLREIYEECGARARIVAQLPAFDRPSRHFPDVIKHVQMHFCTTQKKLLVPLKGDVHHAAVYVPLRKLIDRLTHPADQAYVEAHMREIRVLCERYTAL